MTVDLYLGDCLEILPTLADNSVDAVITDIPYGTTACSWDEVIPLDKMWERVKRVTNVFITTASQPFTSKLVMSNLDWFRYEWIWDKVNSSGFHLSRYQPLRRHENVVIFAKNGHTYNPIISNANPKNIRPINKGTIQQSVGGIPIGSGITKSSKNYDNTKRLPNTIIRYSKFMGDCNPSRKLRKHPTQKPVELYEYLIRTYTNEGDNVCDIAMGSGTTGVACVQTGRNFIGIEIEPKYYEIAEARIAEAQLQMRMPI